MSPTSPTWTAFVAMLREEWRMHSHLFGDTRFALFPLLILLLVALGSYALAIAGTGLDGIAFGLTLFTVFFGLHTGSIGLVSRDAVRDLLGDTTLLVFSARTLPVTERRLVAIFMLKDVVYYTALFLTPIAFGAIAGHSVIAGFPGFRSLALFWFATLLAFVLGIAITLAGIAIASRGVPGEALFLGSLLLAGGSIWQGVPVLSYGPYGVYRDPPPFLVVGNLLAVTGFAVVGIYGFRRSEGSSTTRSDASYRRWRGVLPGGRNGLTAKMLLEVHRSDGGFLKAVFSGGIIFGVTAYLVGLVESITGVPPSTGLTYGGMLSLTAFTTYNWLTVADDEQRYTIYPLDVTDVFQAKFHAFLLLAIPVAAGYYVLAQLLWPAPVLESLVGVAVLFGVGLYLYGLTVYLTGFRPNAFLFDTVKFSVFTLGVAGVLVPILIIAFAIPQITGIHLGIAGGIAGFAGIGGYGLARRSATRWGRERHDGDTSSS